MKLIDADMLERKCNAVDDMTVSEFLSLLRHAPEVDAVPVSEIEAMNNEIVDLIFYYSADIGKPAYYSDQIIKIIQSHLTNQ